MCYRLRTCILFFLGIASWLALVPAAATSQYVTFGAGGYRGYGYQPQYYGGYPAYGYGGYGYAPTRYYGGYPAYGYGGYSYARRTTAAIPPTATAIAIWPAAA